MAIVRFGALLGVLAVFFALAALQPLVFWTRVCSTPSLTKEDCSPAGRAEATDRRHLRHALRHPLDAAQLTVRLLAQ